MFILDLLGIGFYAVVVLGLGKDFLFKSILGYNRTEILVSKPIETSECSTIESYKKVKHRDLVRPLKWLGFKECLLTFT